MNNTNWDEFKCRCSAITKILANSQSNPCITELQIKELAELEKKPSPTEKQKERIAELLTKQENTKKVVLGDTAIEYLMEVYAWETNGMVAIDKEISYVPQMEKGKVAEAESIRMISELEGIKYEKNKLQISNDYLTGEPDVFTGTEIYKAEVITDMKNAWDYVGFLKSIHKAIDNGYKDQVGGYCDITGAKKGKIVRALVSMSQQQQFDYAERLVRKLGCISMESPEFVTYWPTLERSMNFDHIPVRQRLFIKEVEPFTNERKQIIYDRVKVCREWLYSFDEMYKKINS